MNKRPFNLRPDQKKAIEAIRSYFVDGGRTRGKYISAPGTGKTVVLSYLPGVLKANTVVVFVPSLNLVEQTWRAFDRQLDGAFDGFIICSDDTRSQNEFKDFDESDIPDLTDAELVARIGRGVVLRTPEEIARRLDSAVSEPDFGPPTIVFSTYQSSHILYEGVQKSRAKEVDLAICDEAHRLASSESELLTSNKREALRYPPRVVVTLLNAKRRIFATATPKTIAPKGKRVDGKNITTVYSMDDPLLFGGVARIYPYSEAVLDRVVAPFDIVIGHIDKNAAASADFLSLSRKATNDRDIKTVAEAISHEDIRSLIVAKVIASLRESGRLDKVLTYSSSIARAEQNAEDIRALAGVGVAVSSRTPRVDRVAAIAGLESGAVPVIANCRLFGEGHDTPDLGGIAFVDPKNSTVDIVQAIGRACRIPIDPDTGKAEYGKRALVIVPVDNFDYDQNGNFIYRKDGAAAIDTKVIKKNTNNPFAIVEATLAALSNPGIGLYEYSGDFISGLNSRFSFGKIVPEGFTAEPPNPNNGRNHEGLSREELDAELGPEENPVYEGISTEELETLIGGTENIEEKSYTDEEIDLASPRILAIDTIDPRVDDLEMQDFLEVKKIISRYVEPVTIDKALIEDFCINRNTTALRIAEEFSKSNDVLRLEPEAVLYNTIRILQSPEIRKDFSAFLKENRGRGVREFRGRPVYIDIPSNILEPKNEYLRKRVGDELLNVLTLSVFRGEVGEDPLISRSSLDTIRREAKRSKRAILYRVDKGYLTPREKRLLEFAGFGELAEKKASSRWLPTA